MTHPIDPLTPEAFTARILWEAAIGGDELRFLDVWERLVAGHAKEVENAYSEGMNDSGKYDDGYAYGKEEGYDKGYADGRAKKEQDEQPLSSS